MARVVALTPDLLLGSKVEAMLSATGHEVKLVPDLGGLSPGDADLLIADLDTQDPQALASQGVPVLGYYSHVNVETKEAAETAGINLAVPRSRMARELPLLVEKLLDQPRP